MKYHALLTSISESLIEGKELNCQSSTPHNNRFHSTTPQSQSAWLPIGHSLSLVTINCLHPRLLSEFPPQYRISVRNYWKIYIFVISNRWGLLKKIKIVLTYPKPQDNLAKIKIGKTISMGFSYQRWAGNRAYVNYPAVCVPSVSSALLALYDPLDLSLPVEFSVAAWRSPSLSCFAMLIFAALCSHLHVGSWTVRNNLDYLLFWLLPTSRTAQLFAYQRVAAPSFSRMTTNESQTSMGG